MSIALSLAYDAAPNFKLRHTVKTPADPNAPTMRDEYGEVVPPPATVKHHDFEVQLTPARGREGERAGYDPVSVAVDGLVTKTSWDTLTLPPGVGAGSTFALTFRGKAGVLTIGAAPDVSHDLERELVGETFTGVWRG